MKNVIVNVSIMTLILMSCKVGDKDDTAGNQTCDRYDQALDVGFATTSTVDSVQFFLNGTQVCMPHDYELFRSNRGSQGFQGLNFNGRYGEGTCIKNCYSNTDSIVYMKIFECSIGTICDNIKEDLNDFLIKVYASDKTDSILLKRDDLAQLAYNKAYRIFPQSDSLLMSFLEDDHFTYKGCMGEFCIADFYSKSLLCVDASSYSQDYKNICDVVSGFRY